MRIPSVLFVCVKNAGKSQLAAALTRQHAAGHIQVHSAGTQPGPGLNDDVVTVLHEIQASVEGEHPKPIDHALVDQVDRIILLGREATLDQPTSTPVERWDTDEPSHRGITGLERMRLIRDDVSSRVDRLISQLGLIDVKPMSPQHWPTVHHIYAAGIATGHATFESHPPTWDTFDHTRLPDHRFVATRPDQAVLGWIAASPTSTRPVYAGVVEHSLYVAPAAHGAGIGQLLLHWLIESTTSAGIWTIQSGIFPENTASLALHARAGFRTVGTRERLALMTYGPLAGTWRDVLLIERRT